MVKLVDVSALSRKLCQHPIEGQLAYATTENLTGTLIDGYQAAAVDLCLLTEGPAQALCQVQNELNQQGYSLFIYDAYRPKRAVRHFLRWVADPKQDAHELACKERYYPNIKKSELFEQQYFNEDSNHCYGNTVDVVLRNLKTQEFLEMGSCFDFMGEESHHSAGPEMIGEEAYQHRQILKKAMEKFGFESYPLEYWHYALGGIGGREVKEAMDVEISPELKGIA